jgi:hypothetical protein
MNRIVSTLKPIYWLLNKPEQKPMQPVCFDESKYEPNKPCIEIYQPVLGCDNKVYGNSCKAEAAGLLSWKPYTEKKKSDCGCGK